MAYNNKISIEAINDATKVKEKLYSPLSADAAAGSAGILTPEEPKNSGSNHYNKT